MTEPSCDYPICIGDECCWKCERMDKYKAEAAKKMTDEEIRSLQWFLENEPAPGLHVYKDDSGDWVSFPTPKMRDHLCDMGLMEKVDVRGLYVFQTTQAGRVALSQAAP